MEGDPKFTLFWRDGKREVIQGRSIEEATALAGYGGGAFRALDFWAKGDDANWAYVPASREWVPSADAGKAHTAV